MRFNKLLTKSGTKSVFTPLWEEIKRPTIFSFYLLMSYKIISTIQIIALMLEIAVNYFSHTDGTWSNILSVPRVFTFRKKFTLDSPDNVSEAFFVLCCLATLLNYLLIFASWIGTRLMITGTSLAALCMRHYMVLYQYVLYLPIQVFMLEVIDAYSHYNLHMFADGGRSSLLFAIAVISLTFNFISGFLNLRCYSSLYAHKTFTKRNSGLALIDIIYKAVVSVYIVFVETTSYGKWIVIIITLIYMLLANFTFHVQLPFFKIRVIEAYCVLLAGKLASGIVLFITGIFDEFYEMSNPNLPIVAFAFCLPISIAGQFHFLLKTMIRSSIIDEGQCRTENDVFVRLLAMRYIIKKGTATSLKHGKKEANDWSLHLHGVITRHNMTCDNPTCSCRSILELDEGNKGIAAKREKYREFKVSSMRSIYEKGVETSEYSELILLNLAQFYLLYLENYLRSYLVLQAFEKKAKKSFETEMLIEYLKKRIQERMELKLSGGGGQQNLLIGDYENNNLNVTAVVQNDIQFIQLKNLVHEQVTKQLRFWDYLENFELNTRQIEVCCEEVDLVRTKIERLWDSLSLINQKCSSHYLLYGLYQTLVNNTSKKGEKYLNDYTRMTAVGFQENEAITNDNLYDSSTVIVRISMRRDKIEIIEETSGDVEGIFGFQPSELLGTKVGALMSQFFKDRHYNFVMNHFEKGTENALNRIKRLFGYHKDGHIFPIFLYVSIYPNLDSGLSYMGIIRPRKVYNNYILLNHDGSIDSYSPEVAEYLGLETRRKYNIAEICPDFEKINNAFNFVTKKKHGNLYDDIYIGNNYNKRSNEYQVKVTNADNNNNNNNNNVESQKLDEGGERKSQKEYGSMTSDYEVTSSVFQVNNKPGSTTDTKDNGSPNRNQPNKDKSLGLKVSNKTRSQQRRIRRLNTEEMEEYQRVYDQMSISGSVLSFMPQREKLEGSLRNYLCTVSDEIIDFSILRIITLGRNDENLQGEKETQEVNLKSAKPFKNEHKKKEMILGSLLTDAENQDIPISKMPKPGDLQLFRNPFQTEEEHLNIRTYEPEADERSNKGIVLSLLLANPEEPGESQVQISTGRNDIFDYQNNPSSQSRRSEDSNMDNMDQDEHKFEDSKGFIQEMLFNGDFDKIEPASTTNASTRSGGVISKLESLFYKKEANKSSTKLKAYYLIIGVCGLLAIINTILTNNMLNEGSERVQQIMIIGQRIQSMIILNYVCRTVSLANAGYIQNNRHLLDMGIPNYPETVFGLLKAASENVINLNSAFLNYVDNLSEDFESKIFTLIDIRYPGIDLSLNNVEKLNSFQASDTIALSALEVYTATWAQVGQKLTKIDYILLNTVNELYVEMSNDYKIYTDDLDNSLGNLKTITWSLAAVALTIFVMFFLLLVRDLANNHQDKIRFWNSLVKLDTVKSTGHKKMLMIIKENLENFSNNALLRKALMETKKLEIKHVKSMKEKSKGMNTGFKKLKSYKFQNRSYFIVLPFLVILTVILVYFIVIAITVGNQGDNKKIYIDEIRQASSYLCLNMITVTGLMQFIAEGETSYLLGLPVKDALDLNLQQLSKLGDFINSFQTKNDFDPRAFIQRDICIDYTSASRRTRCYQSARGINSQGLSGVLTFAKETMDSVMDYIVTNPTDIQNAIDQEGLLMIEVEWSYLLERFKLLVDNLADGEGREHSSHKTTATILLVVFIVLLFLLNYLLIWKGFRRLDRQKFDNMKVLRVIPVSMILDSKMLKTYLLKSFKEDLSSIKNKL